MPCRHPVRMHTTVKLSQALATCACFGAAVNTSATACAVCGAMHASRFRSQSQLRTQLLDQLRKLAGPDAVRAAGKGTNQTRSMWHAALNCMLAEYLQASNCQFTLSVFNSETDTAPGQPAYSTEELCQLLRLDRQPQLLQRVQELLPSHGELLQRLLPCISTACKCMHLK
jgi:hypothetical protein